MLCCSFSCFLDFIRIRTEKTRYQVKCPVVVVLVVKLEYTFSAFYHFFPPFNLFSAFYPFSRFSAFYPLFLLLPFFPPFTLFSAFPPFTLFSAFPPFTLFSAFPHFTLFSAFPFPFFPFPRFALTPLKTQRSRKRNKMVRN